jgi:hypothetical protein
MKTTINMKKRKMKKTINIKQIRQKVNIVTRHRKRTNGGDRECPEYTVGATQLMHWRRDNSETRKEGGQKGQ